MFRYKKVHNEIEQIGPLALAAEKEVETLTKWVDQIYEEFKMSSNSKAVGVPEPDDNVC